jgi:capsular exopolysaccharide synthesis family protein
MQARVRSLEQERIRLPSDLTEESPAVLRWRQRLDLATIGLGEEVRTAIALYLEDGARIRATIEDLRERLREKQSAAQVLDEIYMRRDVLVAREAAYRQEKESLDQGYLALVQLRDQEEGGQGAARLGIQNIEIERRARLRDVGQVQPSKTAMFVLTVLAALLLSFGAAYLRDFLDDTIRSKADYERFLSLPQMGTIPKIPGKDPAERDASILKNPRSLVAEAFRAVRTGIIFSRRDEELRSFAITSAVPGEGKTTVAANLAITLAQADRGKVLLIDADLRKSRIHKALGVENTIGLTNCLVGSATFEEAVQSTDLESLHILPSGPMPPNPAELLGGRKMTEILKTARQAYEKVILDTPPLLAVTDPSLLAAQVEGTFFVIAVGRTAGRAVQRAVEVLKGVGVVPTGAILTHMRSAKGDYGLEYQYDYTAEE